VGIEYLVQLDEYYSQHLPAKLGPDWLGNRSEYDHVSSAHNNVSALLAPLVGEPRQPAAWTEPLLEVLRDLYQDRELDCDNPHDDLTRKALEMICTTAIGLGAIPVSIAPPAAAETVIAWILESVAREDLPAPPDAGAVELLGWLELPWDDSPALVVTSLNEGFVPEPSAADPFLPIGYERSWAYSTICGVMPVTPITSPCWPQRART
jgi:hypothetical protein